MAVQRAAALAAAVIAIALMFSTATLATGSRGVTVKLKASEAVNAADAGEVQLYGASHALVIGIDKYTNGWSSLSNAVEDARVVAKELERQGFRVSLKTDLKADALRTTLRGFFAIKGADPDARLFLWYAGHGHTIGGEGFMVPADAPPDTSPAFLVSALPMRDFGSLVRLARSKHVLSIFDSCFSGTIFQARAGATPRAITNKTTKPVRQFITSGDAGQQVRDDGSFREYFVRALAGEEKADFNGDGYVTGEELGLFLNQQMTALTSAAQTPKSGKLHDVRFNQGDFVFVLPGNGSTARATPAFGGGMTPEMLFWQSIQNSTDPDMFAEYLRQYPTGSFGGLARLKMKKLQGPQIASLPPTPEPAFKVTDMDGRYVALKRANVRAEPDAKSRKVTTFDADTLVTVTGRVEGADWYRIAHAGGDAYVWKPLLEAVNEAEFNAWSKIKDSKRPQDFEKFLKAHPKGLYADRASRLLAALTPAPAPQVALARPAPVPAPRPQSLRAGDTFRDCDGALVASSGPALPSGASFCGPQMVVVPAGSFTMGSQDSERKWYVAQGGKQEGADWETPQHNVRIPAAFAVGKFEVSKGQYAAFVRETGHSDGDGCFVFDTKAGKWNKESGKSWRDPNYSQSDSHPAVCVNWKDARAYLAWLSRKTGQEYRLLSEAEWEYAA
ncbi:MAG: SUMF1/EgtB/PvdO family nonheme iron enzyme, partial [Phycisphaerales bacterium]|nr:SUMF1/EgtB/PvdO family nonheme iron enzyme [Phycisphaerales bacterium]